MFPRLRLTVNESLLARLRALPEASQRIARRRFVTELGPELQKDVDAAVPELTAGPVSTPFMFATAKSAFYYLNVMIPNGLVETDGKHYLRSGDIPASWNVEISDRLSKTMIRVRNIHPKGKYVYGPRQVQGHKRTGWADNLAPVRARLVNKALDGVTRIWRDSVREALKGRG